jgi:acetyl esterase/lipase
VVVLDYRLAPQYAFPSQILDLFILYLSLLYPPPGSPHDAVCASSMVLAGESVGAAIAMGLLQVLLLLQNQSLLFHGQLVSVPIPAGITVVSCMGEQALCLPSWDSNKQFDIFHERAPFLDPEFPADEIWPSEPPREDLYCKASYLHHPMVSSCTADSWKGAPPMWFGVGQERMADSSKVIAQTAYRDGVCVWWDQYEAMPHCWMFLMPKLPHSTHVFKRWGEVCRKMAKGDDLESRGRWIDVDKLAESDMDVKNLISLEPKEARNMIKAKAKTMNVFYGEWRSAHL